jgi:GNAT superfamily N-acetyltransferase
LPIGPRERETHAQLWTPVESPKGGGWWNYTGRSPFNGDLGWLACHPTHQLRGLGYALSALVTNRFLEAGYWQIQLHTEYYRRSAIKTYLKLGYVPKMDGTAACELWQDLCSKLDWPYVPEAWRRRLDQGSSASASFF